jgi:hypothetical protein
MRFVVKSGAVVSLLAREAGIHPSQLYGWRRQLCARPPAAPDFAAPRIAEDAASIDADLAMLFNNAHSVARQPAGFDRLAMLIDRGQLVARSQRWNCARQLGEQCVWDEVLRYCYCFATAPIESR